MEIFKLFGSILINSAEAEASISKTGEKAEGLAEKFGSVIKKAAGFAAAAVSVKAIGGAIKSAVSSATEFETAFAKVSTLLDASQVDLGAYKKAILDASSSTGVAVSDMSEAVYSAISAGVSAEDAVAFTESAVKLAKGGFTDTAKAIDVVTTALNGYKMSANEADKVSDLLITTQNLGKTTVDELASSMGKVIPIASTANFSVEELSASYATLTKNGIATAEAGTYMKSMLNELTKSGSTTDKALRELTGQGFAELKSAGTSTTEILTLLETEAQNNGKSLKDMFGSAEAGSAALVLMSKSGDEYNDILSEMERSAGAAQNAFDTMSETTAERSERIKNSLANIGITIGEKFLPAIDVATTFVEDHMDDIASVVDRGIKLIGVAISYGIEFVQKFVAAVKDWADNNQETLRRIQELFRKFVAFLEALFGVFGDVFKGDWDHLFSETLPNLLKSAFEVMQNLLSLALDGMVSLVRGIGQALFNAGKAAFGMLWDGIKSVWASISSWVSEKVDWLADKLLFWRKGEKEMSTDGGVSGGRGGISGSHAAGLAFVPYDGYVAELHRGEAVVNSTDVGALLSKIEALLSRPSGVESPVTIIVQSVLDGRIISESVTRHQLRAGKAAGR